MGKAGKGGKGGRTTKAGLIVSVSRIERRMRRHRIAAHLNRYASTAFAAVIQSVMQVLLGDALIITAERGGNRISHRDINRALRGQSQLPKLGQGVLVAGAGVVPCIHRGVMKDPKAKKAK